MGETSVSGMRRMSLQALECKQKSKALHHLLTLYRLVLCAIYYFFWIYLLPYFNKYRIRQEALQLDNGAISHVLRKVPLDKLEEWDSTHDAVGHTLGRATTHDSDTVKGLHDGHEFKASDSDKV
jgi:hypothetical protein